MITRSTIVCLTFSDGSSETAPLFDVIAVNMLDDDEEIIFDALIRVGRYDLDTGSNGDSDNVVITVA